MGTSLAWKLVLFPSLGTLDTDGNPIPDVQGVANRWFSKVICADNADRCRLSGSRYRGPTTQLDPSIVKKNKDCQAVSIKCKILITTRKSLIICKINVVYDALSFARNSLVYTISRSSFRQYFLIIHIGVKNLFCPRKYVSQIFYHSVQMYLSTRYCSSYKVPGKICI